MKIKISEEYYTLGAEGFYLDEDNCNDDCFKETNSDFTDIVIAWKEITFPELK